MGRPLARMSLRLGERRSLNYLYLPAIVLLCGAQARRAGAKRTNLISGKDFLPKDLFFFNILYSL